MKSLISPLSPPSLFLYLRASICSPFLSYFVFPFFSVPFFQFFILYLLFVVSSFFSHLLSSLFFNFSSNSSSLSPFFFTFSLVLSLPNAARHTPKTFLFLSPSSCLPHNFATGDYPGRPQGGARTQRAECGGAGVFHLKNENITGDPVGGDDLWRVLHFCLACSLFCKIPGHPSHPAPSSTPWAMWLSNCNAPRACRSIL